LAENSSFSITHSNVAEKFRTDVGFARTWPHRDDMDGFFIAEFRRN